MCHVSHIENSTSAEYTAGMENDSPSDCNVPGTHFFFFLVQKLSRRLTQMLIPNKDVCVV